MAVPTHCTFCLSTLQHRGVLDSATKALALGRDPLLQRRHIACLRPPVKKNRNRALGGDMGEQVLAVRAGCAELWV